MRAAYRCKEGQKITKKAGGAFDVQWNGKWQWRCLMDKKLPGASVPAGKQSR